MGQPAHEKRKEDERCHRERRLGAVPFAMTSVGDGHEQGDRDHRDQDLFDESVAKARWPPRM
jgi:hypothetical protein